MKLLSPAQWQPILSAHQQRAAKLTADHLARRKAGRHHPVWDFLFDYYPIKPATMAKWHPGAGVALLFTPDAPQSEQPPHLAWRDYSVVETKHGPAVTADLDALWDRRGQAYGYIRELLERTVSNPAHFDCFGLHEWAMVYQEPQARHALPLRLGAAGTDEVVNSHHIRCTHYDAFRFFTPPARPLNFQVITREDQPSCEQRGCLHANMDLYKWGHKLGPLLEGSTWLDCFDLARDCRVLDMEASPYDCRDLGFGVVAIETPAGKAEYVTRQRVLSDRGHVLRQDLTEVISQAENLTN